MSWSEALREKMAATGRWLGRQPPATLGSLVRSAVALIAVVAGARLLDWLLDDTGLPHSVTNYRVVLLGAGISTVVTAILVLADRPAVTGRRAGQGLDPGPFWLSCFALVAGAAFLSDVLARVPDRIEPSWLRSAPASFECVAVEGQARPVMGDDRSKSSRWSCR